jgi:hypothetical protein
MRRHPRDTCQLCDMFEYIGHWGPTIGDPPPHIGYPYEPGEADERRGNLPHTRRTKPSDSGDYSGC